VIGGAAQSIGLYAAGLAVAHGASAVDYLDRGATRLDIAESFGATPVRREASDRLAAAPALGTLLDGFPKRPPESDAYHLVIEAASNGAGLRHAIHCTAPGGTCCPVGYYVGARTGLPLVHMYTTDITLHVSVSHPRAHLPELLQWVHDHDFPAERVTTTLAGFHEAPIAYAAHTTKLVPHREPLT